MDNVIFRKMTVPDVPAVHQLEVQSFITPWSKHALQGELKNKLAHYFVIERDKTIIAYGGMWCMFDEAHITNIAVAPECRKQGYGMFLMLHMMEEALKIDATRMTLEVREFNYAAQALYDRCGFSKAGVRKGYYRDTGEAAFILWNDDIQKTWETCKDLQ